MIHMVKIGTDPADHASDDWLLSIKRGLSCSLVLFFFFGTRKKNLRLRRYINREEEKAYYAINQARKRKPRPWRAEQVVCGSVDWKCTSPPTVPVAHLTIGHGGEKSATRNNYHQPSQMSDYENLNSHPFRCLFDERFDLDADGVIGAAVSVAGTTILTVWDADLGARGSPGDPSRVLPESATQSLIREAASRQPTCLTVGMLRVDMRQFCQVIVPQLPVSVTTLMFVACQHLTADEIALLSEALTSSGLHLFALGFRAENTRAARAAIVALCEAHTSLANLSLDGFDDSQRSGGTPYALCAALNRTPTGLRKLSLNITPRPHRRRWRQRLAIRFGASLFYRSTL